MRIAFAIVKLFPGGGLQRDCVEIARLVKSRGHETAVFTAAREPDSFANDLSVTVLPGEARTNHRMQERFSVNVLEAARGFDLLVGFSKLEGLDLLYCADPSVRHRLTRAPWLALLPRYRTLQALEGASFEPGGGTQVLLLGRGQRDAYADAWHTEPERLVLLPPTIASARRQPDLRRDLARDEMRRTFGLPADACAWLLVGVQPKTKGIDRAIRALADFPDARLLVAGLAGTSTPARRMERLADRRGVAARLQWLGHREDMPRVMAAADLLVHPARYDTTGTVILEAIVNGLPVVTTAACGYAEHVTAAQAGIVLPEPFAPAAFRDALRLATEAGRRVLWSANGEAYGAAGELYAGRERAADLIITAAHERAGAGRSSRIS